MVIFHSYVSLPEGTNPGSRLWLWLVQLVAPQPVSVPYPETHVYVVSTIPRRSTNGAAMASDHVSAKSNEVHHVQPALDI